MAAPSGTELAVAYVSLAVSTKDLGKGVAKELGGIESEAERTGKRAGGRMSGALVGALKAGAAGAAAAGIATLGTAMVKGFQRLNALDQATAKLRGLGHSAESVDKIMESALGAVRGTAFGMGEAATTAAGAIAAGIEPGKELQRTLTLVADAATIGGTSMGEMGAIFNKVATSNKVQGEVIAQLGDRGIPIIQLLAEQLGVSAEETVKLASEGKINFETFQKAMESGMGGAAQESGQTFSGAMDNVMASLGRVGANVLEGIFPAMKDGLLGLQDALAPVEEGAKRFGEAIGGFITEWQNGEGTGGKFRDVLEGIGGAFEAAYGFVLDNWEDIKLIASMVLGAAAAYGLLQVALFAMKVPLMIATAAQWLYNAALSANPIGIIIVAIGALVAAFIYLWNNNEDFRNAIIAVWEAIKGAVKVVLDWFTGTLLPGIRGVWEAIVNAFIAVRDKFVEIVNKIVYTVRLFVAKVKMHFLQMYANIFNTVQTIRDKVTESFGKIRDGVVNIVTGIRDTVVTRFTSLRDRVLNVVNKFRDKIKSAFDKIKDGIVKVASGIRDTAGGIFDKISDLAKKPIKFVIETVLNNGLIKGANTVAKVVGLGANWIPRIPLPKGFASGGWTGPGSKFQPAGAVHADEFVIQKSMRGMFEKKFPGYLQHINQHGTLPGYAGGGQVAPVGGKGNRHVSGYPWATWAGDFPQPMGTPIAAWKDGIIALVRHLTTSYGKHVRINHDDGTSSLYAHMSRILATVGQRVIAGQKIGEVGSTGNSTGPHLHFETMGGPYKAKGGGGILDLFKGFPNPLSWLNSLIGGALGKSPGGGMLGDIVGKVPGMLADAVKDKISIFDNGGWLKPGHLAYNGLSKPEPIFTPGQWDKMNSAGGDFEVRVFIGDRELTDIVDTQIVRSVSDTRRMALQTARSGRTRS